MPEITDNEIREVVKAQLRHTADALLSGAGDHDHIEDDCGDDIANSLSCTAELHAEWHRGSPDAVRELLAGWAEPHDTEGDSVYERSELWFLHGNGGVSDELADLIERIGPEGSKA